MKKLTLVSAMAVFLVVGCSDDDDALIPAITTTTPTTADTTEAETTTTDTDDTPAGDDPVTENDSIMECSPKTFDSTIDSYEPDNLWYHASLNDGTLQFHTIYPVGDFDIVKFSASADSTYTIRTLCLSDGTDTIIRLYNINSDMLAQDDDGGDGLASEIKWECSYSDTYYIKINIHPLDVGSYYILVTEN